MRASTYYVLPITRIRTADRRYFFQVGPCTTVARLLFEPRLSSPKAAPPLRYGTRDSRYVAVAG